MDDIVSHETVDIRKEVEMLKDVLVLKSEQIKSIMEQMTRLENDINSIKKNINKLDDRDRIRMEEIDRENDERDESDKQYRAKLTKHIDKNVTAITQVIDSNKQESATDSKSLRDDIQTIKTEMNFIRSQILLIQAPVAMKNIEARCDWVVDGDWRTTGWVVEYKTSGYFTGAAHPYKYQLAMRNGIRGDSMFKYLVDFINREKSMLIWLRIHSSPNDGQLDWPFERQVVLTVADKGRIESSSTISQQCTIEKPHNECVWSEPFIFVLSELIEAGIDLSHGVRLSCEILTDLEQ